MLATGLCLLIASHGAAQAPASPRSMTLFEAFNLAFEQSPEMREARRSLSAAEKRRALVTAEQGFRLNYRGDANREVDEDRNLTLNVDAPGLGTEESRFSRLENRTTLERTTPLGGTIEFGGGLRNTVFASTRTPERTTTRSRFTAELTQPLFRLNAARVEREEADLALEIARARFTEARADLAQLVTDRFIDYVAAVEERVIRRMAVEDAARLLEVTRAQFAAGEARGVDLARSELALRDAEISERENEVTLIEARGRFAELTSLVDPSVEPEFGSAADPALELPPPPERFDRHPRIVRTTRRVEEERLSLLKTRDRGASRLEMTGRHSWEADKDAGGLFENFLRAWNVGARVTVPFYDGGARRLEREIAESELAAAKEEQAREEERVRREAIQAGLDAEISVLRHANALSRQTQADSEVMIERTLYQAGEGRLVDLLERRTRLTEAQLDVIRARGELIRRRIAYLAAIGVDPHDYLIGRLR